MATTNFYLRNYLKKPLTENQKIRYKNKVFPDNLLLDKQVKIWMDFVIDRERRYKTVTYLTCQPKHWDFREKKFKSSYPGAIENNNILDNIRNDIDTIFKQASKEKMSPRELFVNLKPKVKAIALNQFNINEDRDFFGVLNEFIRIKSKEQAHRTIQKYETLKTSLTDFQGEENYHLTFERINLEFYDKYKAWLLKGDKLDDTIAKYISTLKTFLLWALEREHHTNTKFMSFKAPRKPKLDIVTLNGEELLKLYTYDFSKNRRLERVRDVFCFACFTGQRWGDISNFDKSQIQGNVWVFITEKTKDKVNIPFTGFAKPALQILQKYDYHLPVISPQKFNDYLKEAGKSAGIDAVVIKKRWSGNKEIITEEPKHRFLSSHMARRTFVTYLLERGVPPTTVMKYTKHKRLATLQKYENTSDEAAIMELERVGELGKMVVNK